MSSSETLERVFLGLMLILVFVLINFPGTALAFQDPQPGTFFYQGWDFVNQYVVKGAGGALVGWGIVGFALYSLFQHQMAKAITSGIVGVSVANLGSMANALGFLC